MDIKITSSNPKETKEFEIKEWTAIDAEHWGREIEWKEFGYRFKAELNGQIVGLIFGTHEAGTTYVHDLIVAKEHRGKGIGTKLLTFIEHWTVEQGGHKVWFVTQSKWEASKLYDKLNYKVTCTLKKHFLGEDFVLYEKILT